jgi:hypothetical protein
VGVLVSCDLMEVFLVLVAVVVGYFWLRAGRRRKQELLELRRFTHDRMWSEKMGVHWVADFVEMRATVQGFDYDGIPPGTDFGIVTLYALRRRDGAWETRITDESRLPAIERLRARLKREPDGPLDASTYDVEKKALEGLHEPKWTVIDDEVAGPLESQYQRFLLHYKQG